MSAPLNVLALVTDAWGGRGGIAQYNRDFLESLSRAPGVGTFTVLPRAAPDVFATPANVVQSAPRGGVAAYVAAALATALTRRVDVVFCGHVFMAPLALIVARLKRARLVVQAHGVEVWGKPARLRRTAVEAADAVLCVSRHTRSSIAAWAAMPPERLIVVPNTVGEAYTPGDGRALRASLGLDGKRVLLTVGRMAADEQQKGHDRVIGILPQLVRTGHDAAYVVIGEGDDRPRLEALAATLGVGERLVFLGAAPQATAVEAYQMADLFMMPSKQEGFGIAFVEAMACGTPAIGLPVGGTADALADGALGRLANEDDLARDVAAALDAPRPDRKILADAVRQRFGRDAFDRATAGFAERIREMAATSTAGTRPLEALA